MPVEQANAAVLTLMLPAFSVTLMPAMPQIGQGVATHNALFYHVSAVS